MKPTAWFSPMVTILSSYVSLHRDLLLHLRHDKTLSPHNAAVTRSKNNSNAFLAATVFRPVTFSRRRRAVVTQSFRTDDRRRSNKSVLCGICPFRESRSSPPTRLSNGQSIDFERTAIMSLNATSRCIRRIIDSFSPLTPRTLAPPSSRNSSAKCVVRRGH